jgi:hypothetical protein
MQEMGKEARQEYENKYTAEKNYPMLIEIYRHAVAGRDVLGTDVHAVQINSETESTKLAGKPV